MEAFRQWFRGRSLWIKALIIVVSLLLALSLLRVLFANSFWVFLVSCAVGLLLTAVHRRRSGGNPAVDPNQTIGRIGATALSAAFVCMLIFEGTAIAKAIMRSGGGSELWPSGPRRASFQVRGILAIRLILRQRP